MLSKKERCIAFFKDPVGKERDYVQCQRPIASEQGCRYFCQEHANEFMILGWPGASFVPAITTEKSKSRGMCRDPFAIFVDTNKWTYMGDQGLKVMPYSEAINPNVLIGKPPNWIKLDKSPIYHNFCNNQECVVMFVKSDVNNYNELSDIKKLNAHKPHLFRLSVQLWERILQDFPMVKTFNNNVTQKVKIFPPIFSVKGVTSLINYYMSNPETHYPFWTTTLTAKDWNNFYHGLNLLQCQNQNLIDFASTYLEKYSATDPTILPIVTIVTLNDTASQEHFFTQKDAIIQKSGWLRKIIGNSKNNTISVVFDSFQLSIILNKLGGTFKTNDPCSVMNVINDIIFLGFEFGVIEQEQEKEKEFVLRNLFTYLGNQRCGFKNLLSQMWVNTSDRQNDPFINGVELLRTQQQHQHQQQHHQLSEQFEYYFPKFIRDIEDIPDYEDFARRYAKCRPVSKGAFGSVESCFDNNSSDNRLVALKKQKIEHAHSDIKHMIKEINLLLHVCPHTNILNIENFFKDRENVYIAMPYHSRGTLTKKIDKATKPPHDKPWIHPKPMSISEIKSIMQQILHGLAWVHQRGVIHADLKPDNIMENSKNHLEIIDFGSAKTYFHNRGYHFKHGTEIVTLLYRAPELFPNLPFYTTYLTPAIDMWSAGVILLQLLTPTNPNDSPFAVSSNKLIKYFADTRTQQPDKTDAQEWNKIYNIIVNDMLRDMIDFDKKVISQNKILNLLHAYGDPNIIGHNFNADPLCDLLFKLLTLNPNGRIDAANALSHPAFNGITHYPNIEKRCAVSVSQMEREKERKKREREDEERKRRDRSRDRGKRERSRSRYRGKRERSRSRDRGKRDRSRSRDRKRERSRSREQSVERSRKKQEKMKRIKNESQIEPPLLPPGVKVPVRLLPPQQPQPLQQPLQQPQPLQRTHPTQPQQPQQQLQEQQLMQIIQQFKDNTSDSIEFEVRFDERMDFPKFKSALRNFIDNAMCGDTNEGCGCEQSISRIGTNSENKKIRKDSYYQLGKKVKQTTTEKEIIRLEKFSTFKISMANETIVVDKHVTDNPIIKLEHIRIKLRTFIIKGMWKYDFTATLELKNESDVQKFASKLLTTNELSPVNVIQHLENIYDTVKQDMKCEYEIEFVGDKSLLTSNDILQAIDILDSYKNYQSILYQIAKSSHANQLENYLEKYSLKQLCNQPRNLTKQIFESRVKKNISSYYVSDKADGERCFVVFLQNKTYILLSNKIVDMTHVFGNPNFRNMTVLDAEIVHMETNPTVYIFDILVDDNVNVTREIFKLRQGRLDKYVTRTIVKKLLVQLDSLNYRKQIYDAFHRIREYENDGLIFTPIDGQYFTMNVYKWKEPEKLTIDFLIVTPPKHVSSSYPQKEGYDLHMLFSGVSEADNQIPLLQDYDKIIAGIPHSKSYFPIHFQPNGQSFNTFLYYHPTRETAKLNHKIGEFIWNGKEWILHRMRPDKSILVKKGVAYGNNYRIAREIFDMYENPLTLQMLTQ